MVEVWVYGILSVVFVSLVSLIGIATFALKEEKLKKILLYLVSFAAGGLLGDALIHLLPEIVEQVGFGIEVSMYVLSGIIFSFIIEKFLHWRHCHIPTSENHPHPFAYMNLYADAIHNFIDGLIIGGSYLVSVPVGIATTFAVLFHEIPQEIGDFGILLHGGFSRGRAVMFNFLSAVTAIIGAVIALVLAGSIEGLTLFLIPFAAGHFIYIASSDLIPELHKETIAKKSFVQLVMFLIGILLMFGLLVLG